MCSEYPRVDGHLSNECYLRALDSTYNSYAEKFKKLTGVCFGSTYCVVRFVCEKSAIRQIHRLFILAGNEMTLNSFDYAIFHAPYNKLVQVSLSLALNYNTYHAPNTMTEKLWPAHVPRLPQRNFSVGHLRKVEFEYRFVCLTARWSSPLPGLELKSLNHFARWMRRRLTQTRI